MRLWIFLLCMIIVSALSIWGCVAIIDSPVEVTAGAFDSDITNQTCLNEPFQVSLIGEAGDLTFQLDHLPL